MFVILHIGEIFPNYSSLITAQSLLTIFEQSFLKMRMLCTDDPEKNFRQPTLTSKRTITATTTDNILPSGPSTTGVVIRQKNGDDEVEGERENSSKQVKVYNNCILKERYKNRHKIPCLSRTREE